MKFITSRMHSILDYAAGLILLTGPFIAGMDKGTIPFTVSVMLGAFTVLVSLFTNYEGGLVRYIPFRFHLVLDVLQAAILGLSPWLFGFTQKIWVPFIVISLLELGIVLCTRSEKDQADQGLSIERLNRLRHKWNRSQDT